MKTQSVRQERQKVILIVGFTYILPVVLIFVGLVPFSWRFAVLILSAMVILVIARLYRFSPVELGFTQKHLRASLKAIALPTLAIALLILVHYITQGTRLDNSAYNWTFYLLFVGVSSPVQEFLYRGFLFGIFSRAKFPISLQIFLSTLLYSCVHLIYRDVPTLVLTFIVGLLWGWHYAKFRNLYTVILSHSLLGAIAILVGLV
ncbi:Abortive infection protein (plasmid) [Trichormus variabilis ATCC 29413]|uniref:Abortive infection protein n=2 Tax=Anabaena variabilis TaxID=264691 RepID=Q3M1K2_TRIV2|nr:MULTISPECIES: type II CAAX endopeptidase family protein [Nostocaceae]ABA25141.1 Abortive infection protein [Trichormus variabilis ATCC 29413]MBC1218263.1 CPBP family intramembrane metalloprotease [Trichormus variabilis ARAD]MBC1259596.1 CPBP family intramembrane metalloprotease [Trichormus variabilis V5]MBC1271019.1 CPBP family intramembrane metalloprotease [Trichormus variabilis FSR]MBC1306026.1 CPBP family intramembrane metalloprotease [Trichormus variabilis N2B]